MKRLFVFFAILLVSTFALAGEPIFFVQLTDTHFGQGDNFERASAAVEAINALPMDISFVALTGDIMQNCITDSNQVGRVFQILEPLKMPIHFVPGNHDLLKEGSVETVSIFTNHFGPLISATEYGGVQFVFVCTEPLAGGVQIEGYDPLAELEPLLANCSSVVFHHIPSVDDFYSNKMHLGWGRSEMGQRWVALLNRHDVKAVIAGHFHCAEQHWLGDVPLYVGPPLSGWLKRQASFRVYEYRDGRLSYRTQYIQ